MTLRLQRRCFWSSSACLQPSHHRCLCHHNVFLLSNLWVCIAASHRGWSFAWICTMLLMDCSCTTDTETDETAKTFSNLSTWFYIFVIALVSATLTYLAELAYSTASTSSITVLRADSLRHAFPLITDNSRARAPPGWVGQKLQVVFRVENNGDNTTPKLCYSAEYIALCCAKRCDGSKQFSEKVPTSHSY